MAAGTVTYHGPYPIDGTGVAAALSAAGGGAAIKSINVVHDAGNRQVYYVVCTEA